MKRLFLSGLAAFSFSVSCSPAPGEGPSETGGSSSGTGGDSSGTGGDASVLAPVPTGPGTTYDASLGTFCPQFECGNVPPFQVYQVVERCDDAGTWEDPNCAAASFAWQLVEETGTFEKGGGSVIRWNTSVTTNWTVSYPASCGGCAIEASLSEQWTNLSCEEGSDGACSCTGRGTIVTEFEGTTVASNGGMLATEYPTPEEVAEGIDPPTHWYAHCGTETQLILYDEYGGHVYLEPIE